jgi:hypothetical protein
LEFTDQKWSERFFGYLREKAKGDKAWWQLAFGTNPVLQMQIAGIVAADEPGEIELARRKRKSFAASQL